MLAALAVAGCVTLRADEPLGSVSNPVRVDGRPGEFSYLGRLRCPSSHAPHFHFRDRGPRGPYGNGLDRFDLRCVMDNLDFVVWIDHDHPGTEEQRPIPGLGIVDPPRLPPVPPQAIAEPSHGR